MWYMGQGEVQSISVFDVATFISTLHLFAKVPLKKLQILYFPSETFHLEVLNYKWSVFILISFVLVSVCQSVAQHHISRSLSLSLPLSNERSRENRMELSGQSEGI